jgi:hypothetical protein
VLDPDPAPPGSRRKLLLRDVAFKFCSLDDKAAGGTAPFGWGAVPRDDDRSSCEPLRD